MLEVLFNADDFGLTKSITDGIIDAHVNGLVNSATLMMNGNAVDYAVALAKEHPSLQVGIHLVLTWGKPLDKNLPTLVDGSGYFKFSSIEPSEIDTEAVKKEWTTQIEKFLQTGLSLHHMDSHHHVHGWQTLQDVIVSLAKKYKVPVRSMPSIQNHTDILLTEIMWDGFYDRGVSSDIFTDIKHLQGKTVEVMTHPSYVDEELRQVSSYVEKRQEELEILTSIHPPNWVTLK